MNRNKKKLHFVKNRILAVLTIVILFLIIVVLRFFVFDGPEKTLKTDIIMFGDSIFGVCHDETSVPAILAKKLNTNVYNAAFGGTAMSRKEILKQTDSVNDILSMHALSQAMLTDDFGPQLTIRNKENATYYFEGVVDDLSVMDFESASTIIIEHCVNDYHMGVDLSSDDIYDELTYEGALRCVVESVMQKYPDIKIVLVSPTYTWYPDRLMTCEEYKCGEYLLEDYVNSQEKIAAEYGLDFIDLYHDLYKHNEWSDWELYTIYGLEPY